MEKKKLKAKKMTIFIEVELNYQNIYQKEPYFLNELSDVLFNINHRITNLQEKNDTKLE